MVAVGWMTAKARADFEAQDVNCSRPLHWAACKRHVEVVSLILKAGSDLQAKDTQGQTAVLLGASSSHPEIVSLLGGDVGLLSLRL